MRKKERYEKITGWFSSNVPSAQSELRYDSPFHLLIAVILSAQCTDKRVNMYTPALFERFPDPQSLATASFEEVYGLIKSISFPNNKARHLIGMAQVLMRDFGGTVPSDPDDLVRMPGVGRKTANVIRGNVYGDASIVVDTHVKRISGKLDFTAETDPEKIEKDLMEVLPKENWIRINMQLITLGREICTARSPKCECCFLADLCPGKDRKETGKKGGRKRGSER